MVPQIGKRRLVRASGAAALLALTGCLGGDSSDENDTATDNGTGDRDNSSGGDDGSDDGDSASALSEATSFVAAHTFSDDRLSAEAAAVCLSAEALDGTTERLEATFGSDAQDTLLGFEADRVSVTGIYRPGAGEG